MKVLIAGGAGYIGSHMVKTMLRLGHEVITFDNLSTGFRDAVTGGEFVEGDLADSDALRHLFKTHAPEAVMHFASSIQVGESVHSPDLYYRNNLSNTLNLIDVMVSCDVKRFIFSSSAAIFGEPAYVPIDEKHATKPVNPYGKSKAMVEQILTDYDSAYGLKYICLRYFNAAGADPDGELGERHEPETHLIPLILQAASGRRSYIEVFGRDYPTPDGTCIRDYIHILDLCSAHVLALDYLTEVGKSNCFNLGNGTGFSVQQVINVVEQVTASRIRTKNSPRRSGDPARLVADAGRARNELGWTPHYTNLRTIVEDAWRWECKVAGQRCLQVANSV